MSVHTGSAVLEQPLRSNICSVIPKYSLIKTELLELILIFQISECGCIQDRRQINILDRPIAESAFEGIISPILNVCYLEIHISGIYRLIFVIVSPR